MARYSEYSLVQVAGLFLFATVLSIGLIYFINAENHSRHMRLTITTKSNRISSSSSSSSDDSFGESESSMMRDSTATLSSTSGPSTSVKDIEKSSAFPKIIQSLSTLAMNDTTTTSQVQQQSHFVKRILNSFYHRFINGLKRISNSFQEETKEKESSRLVLRNKRSLISSPEELYERQVLDHYTNNVKERKASEKNEISSNNNKRIRHLMKKILRQHHKNDEHAAASTNENNNQSEYKERNGSQDYDNDNEDSSGSEEEDTANYGQGESPSSSSFHPFDRSRKTEQEVVQGESLGESQEEISVVLSRRKSIFNEVPPDDSNSVTSGSNYFYKNNNNKDPYESHNNNGKSDKEEEIFSKVEKKPIQDFCYKTDEVLFVVAITCCLNFTFVLGIWASVRWLGVGSSSKRKRKNRRCGMSGNTTMKMVAFTDDDIDVCVGDDVGKKYLKPNHCCLSYDEEDDLYYTSSSEDEEDDDEDDKDETYYYQTDVKDNLVFDNKIESNQAKRLSSKNITSFDYASIAVKRSRSMEDLKC